MKIALKTDTIQSTWLTGLKVMKKRICCFWGYFDISTCLFELFECEGLELDMQAKTNPSKRKDSSIAEMLNSD